MTAPYLLPCIWGKLPVAGSGGLYKGSIKKKVTLSEGNGRISYEEIEELG